jgi:hypothetical protein
MRLFVGAVSQGGETLKGRPSLSAATASLAAAKYHYDGLGVVVSSFFFTARWIFYAYEACSVSFSPSVAIPILFLHDLCFICQLVYNTGLS